MSDARYITRTETAKLIRKALKSSFSNITFSVRSESYSGGGSITVQWVDGPTEKQVKSVIGAYEGSGFDGMVDLPYYFDAWLTKDGKVSIAKCQHLDIDNPPPSEGAELVHFSSGYMFTKRFFSPEFVRRVAAEISEQIGWPIPEIIETESYWSNTKEIPTAYFKDTRGNPDHDEHVYREYNEALHNTAENEPAESQAARSDREYQEWLAENETQEPEDEPALTAAIHEAEIADIAKNRADADQKAAEMDQLKALLRSEIRAVATDIINSTDSVFIQRCASRKLAAVETNPDLTLDDLLKVGGDLTLIAERLSI